LNPINTLKAWVMMGGYVLFGYVYFLQGGCDRRRRERWLLISALTGAAWGLFGIVRVLFTGEAAGRALMIASTYSYGAFRPFFREHGTYSAYLGMLLPASLLCSLERTGRERIIYGVSTLLIGCGVTLAFARAGWLAVVLVVPLAALAWAFRHREGNRLLIPASAVLLVTLLAVASGISRQVAHHAETAVSAENLSNLERFNRWTAALAMTRDRPLTGVGYGAYLDAYRAYRGKSIVTDQAFIRMGTHSEPLKLLSELGVPGFLAAVWFLLAVFRLGWRAFWELPNRGDRVLALAALAGFATYVVNGMFNSYLVEDKVTIPFWSAIGVIAALGGRLENAGRVRP
jgi:O-antigen ligase